MYKKLMIILVLAAPYLFAPNYEAQLTSFINMNFKIQCSDNNPENGTVTYPTEKNDESVKFEDFRNNIKNTWVQMFMVDTGSNIVKCTVNPNDLAARLYDLVKYTNDIKLETLPNDVQEVVKQRRKVISAFEHSRIVELADLLKEQDKKPLLHPKEKEYQERFQNIG